MANPVLLRPDQLRLLRSSTGWFIALERVVLGLIGFLSRAAGYPFRKASFGDFHWTTTIHPACEFRQRCNIALASGVVLHRGVVIHAPVDSRVSIGEKSQINPYVVIYGRVTIGRKVMIAPHAMLVGGNHGFTRRDVPIQDQVSSSKGGICIEDDVWIGANAVLLDGVTVGTGVIVAAGAIVTKSIEPYCIVAGVPARKIGERNGSE